MTEDLKNNIDNITESHDEIRISNDVVATIAGIAAAEVPGVAAMSGGISNILGRKQLTRGIKVEINNGRVTVDIALIIEYGAVIPDVAAALQSSVKNSIMTMTGLEVEAVNVSVQGVSLPDSAPAETAEPENIEE